MIERNNSFLAITVQELSTLPEASFMEKMMSGFAWYKETYSSREESPHPSQLESWRDCLQVMKNALHGYQRPHDWVIFEYCLPQEGGRRPDVLILGAKELIVLEFKRKRLPALVADLDQAAAYGFDLKEFHAESHELAISTYLVQTMEPGAYDEVDTKRNLTIISPTSLTQELRKRAADDTPVDVEKWLAAPYQPSLSILDAAYHIMKYDSLPEIRRAKSIGINDTLKKLEQLEEAAYRHANDHARVVVFVTGVPGAGKTYLGLQFIYQISKKSNGRAAYLSGNAPLIKILQNQLGKSSSSLVRAINNFFSGSRTQYGTCQALVFDEGQRAWSRQGNRLSEPEELMDYLAKQSWGILVVLIGEGQQIHQRETITQADWAQAIANYGNSSWLFLCPPSMKKDFYNVRVKEVSELNLSTSLRTSLDELVPRYFNLLLDNHVTEAAQLAGQIKGKYPLYITRDASVPVQYCRERYHNAPQKHYGWLRSSQYNRNRNGRRSPSDYIPWFTAPTDSEKSCCAMQQEVAATEFECQGLELDFAVVEWGIDFLWEGHWQPHPLIPSQENDRYRLNAYRVLLTRGRDGLMIYVPKNPALDATYNALVEAGFTPM